MMPQSKKRPERPESSRAKSVAPPIRRELSGREVAELAAKTAELKLQASQKAKEAYAKEREKTDAQEAQANGSSSSGVRRGHDLTSLLEGVKEDQAFKQVVFLCLARLYAVFCPSEISDIQTRITEQTGQWKELLEKVTNRFLSQFDARFLVSHLLNEARYPQRREELDLEEANISLELAYLRIEEMDLEDSGLSGLFLL